MSMNCLPPFEAVLNANFQGIALMRQHQYKDAIPFFQKGLKDLWSAINIAMSRNGEPKRIGGPATDTFNLSHIFLSVRVDECDQRDCDQRIVQSTSIVDESLTSAEYDVFLLFDRALTITPKIDHVLEDSEPLQYLTLAVLLYNTGLCLHLESLRKGHSHMLRQAHQCYEMSYGILCDGSLTNEQLLSALPRMALLNNIGHIHAQFGSFNHACICKNSLLLYIHEQNKSATFGLSLSDNESSFFIENCIVFPQWEHMSAPAA